MVMVDRLTGNGELASTMAPNASFHTKAAGEVAFPFILHREVRTADDVDPA